MLILVALHDVGHALRFTDGAMVLHHGRLVTSGPTRDVVTPDLMRRVFGVSSRIESCSGGVPQLLIDSEHWHKRLRAAHPAGTLAIWGEGPPFLPCAFGRSPARRVDCPH